MSCADFMSSQLYVWLTDFILKSQGSSQIQLLTLSVSHSHSLALSLRHFLVFLLCSIQKI